MSTSSHRLCKVPLHPWSLLSCSMINFVLLFAITHITHCFLWQETGSSHKSLLQIFTFWWLGAGADTEALHKDLHRALYTGGFWITELDVPALLCPSNNILDFHSNIFKIIATGQEGIVGRQGTGSKKGHKKLATDSSHKHFKYVLDRAHGGLETDNVSLWND